MNKIVDFPTLRWSTFVPVYKYIIVGGPWVAGVRAVLCSTCQHFLKLLTVVFCLSTRPRRVSPPLTTLQPLQEVRSAPLNATGAPHRLRQSSLDHAGDKELLFTAEGSSSSGAVQSSLSESHVRDLGSMRRVPAGPS